MAGRRPVRLTPDIIAAIGEAFRLGVPQAHAAAIAGVHHETLRRWLRAGEAERDRLTADPTARPDPKQAQYVALVGVIREQDARHVQEALALIRRAATSGRMVKTKTYKDKDGEQIVETTVTEGGLWTAAAWLLERTHHTDFARRTVTEVTGADGGPVHVDVAADRQLADRVAAYLQGVTDTADADAAVEPATPAQ